MFSLSGDSRARDPTNEWSASFRYPDERCDDREATHKYRRQDLNLHEHG